MSLLSIRIGSSILLILYILVLQLFHLLFWLFTTNWNDLLSFLHVYPGAEQEEKSKGGQIKRNILKRVKL